MAMRTHVYETTSVVPPYNYVIKGDRLQYFDCEVKGKSWDECYKELRSFPNLPMFTFDVEQTDKGLLIRVFLKPGANKKFWQTVVQRYFGT